MQKPLKPTASLADRKKLLVRDTILDAAERLVRSGEGADLTMRALADEAGVSLSTPFKHFGSKARILAGLVDRMLNGIAEQYIESISSDDPVYRVLAMGNLGVQVMLSDPQYYKYICQSLSSDLVIEEDSSGRRQAEDLWSIALASGSFSRKDLTGLYETYVPQLLGVVFRGVMIMWMTGEVADTKFARAVETSLAGVLLGLVEDAQRADLVARLIRF